MPQNVSDLGSSIAGGGAGLWLLSTVKWELVPYGECVKIGVAIALTILGYRIPARLPAYYAANTTLRMIPEAIALLQDSDIATFQQALRSLLPGFDQFPEVAQEAPP